MFRIRLAQMLMLCCFAATAVGQSRRPQSEHAAPQQGRVFDHHFNHDRYYPARGAFINELPREHVRVEFRGTPYHFYGGAWYRHDGPRFVVVSPPIGLLVPILPPFYTTLWIRGEPYYYADDAYYRWTPERRAYEVVSPPTDADDVTTTTGSNELFVYPAKGQTDEQQATDRYECYRWAREQSGFDPTQPPPNQGVAAMDAKRASYRRAETACLQGRGYSVK